MTKKRILFVDDEPNVLQGLRRMLHALRDEWDIGVAESGAQALDLLAQSSYDVIVSDMRMPGMDGAQLLTEVMRLYPQIVRIVLSGQSDQETLFRSVGPTHQFLSKPCSAEILQATIERACRLRDVLASDKLRMLASQIKSLPSLPAVYTEILRELQSPEPAIEKVGRIIARDAGMTAKILQLVNSAFFGFCSRVSDPVRAVTILGLEKIRSLVLSIHIFSEFSGTHATRFDLGALWHHNLFVGQCAKEIVKSLSLQKPLMEEAFMAGLLHDTGTLMLMANLPEEYGKALDQARTRCEPLEAGEKAILGATHAEIGAYLLGLWGLPTAIVEAVAYHHRPGECLNRSLSALTAVHAADTLVREAKPLHDEGRPEMDVAYLEALGVAEKIGDWRDVCNCNLVRGESR